MAPREALARGFTILENVRSFRFDGQIDTAGTPVDVQGEVIRDSAARVTVGTNEFILANETLYLKQPDGTWFGVRVADAGERMPPIFDPQEQLRAVVQGRDFRLVGTEMVRGTPTAVYSFTSTEGGQTQEIKVWISLDERPRKLEISEGGQVLTTLFFSDFNEVADIRAPEGAEIVDADRLVEALPSPAPRLPGR